MSRVAIARGHVPTVPEGVTGRVARVMVMVDLVFVKGELDAVEFNHYKYDVVGFIPSALASEPIKK